MIKPLSCPNHCLLFFIEPFIARLILGKKHLKFGTEGWILVFCHRNLCKCTINPCLIIVTFFYRLGAKDKDRKSPPDHLNTIGRNSWIRNIRISQPLDACLHRYVFWLPIVPSGSGSLLFVGLCVDLSSLCRPVELLRPKNNSDTLLPNFMAVPRALGARILWMIDFEAKARVL